VGIGHFINIWEDNWLPLQNGYKLWTQKPIQSDLSQVSQLILLNSGGWNMQLINDIFLPFEAIQISQIPLPLSAQMDRLTWDPHKKGIFFL
jgi:hypothetical protein